MSRPALISEKALHELFDILNTLIFNNSIQTRPVFQALSNRKALKSVDMQNSKLILYGICFDEQPVRIVFNKKVVVDHHILVVTLVHEMIHMLQFETKCTQSHHGAMFQNWSRKIKRRHNIDI